MVLPVLKSLTFWYPHLRKGGQTRLSSGSDGWRLASRASDASRRCQRAQDSHRAEAKARAAGVLFAQLCRLLDATINVLDGIAREGRFVEAGTAVCLVHKTGGAD